MADVTAPQFQQDVNNAADWANGDENTTVTMRLGQQADSPAKVIKRADDLAEAQRDSIDALAAAQREDIYEKVTPAVKGAFEAGFTFQDLFERGKFGTEPSETYWAFTGGTAGLPHVVTAGTDPTLGGPYEQVTLNVASDVSVSGGGSVQGYIDTSEINYQSVTSLKNGKPNLSSLLDNADLDAKTRAYYDGWAAINSEPSGGANYLLSTLQRVRDLKGDQSWVPDGFSDHYLLGGNTYVAILNEREPETVHFGARVNSSVDSTPNCQAMVDKLEYLRLSSGKHTLDSSIEFTNSLSFVDGVYGETVLSVTGSFGALTVSGAIVSEVKKVTNITFTSETRGQGSGIFTEQDQYLSHWDVSNCIFERKLAFGFRCNPVGCNIHHNILGFTTPDILDNFKPFECLGENDSLPSTPLLPNANVISNNWIIRSSSSVDSAIHFRSGVQNIFEENLIESNQATESIFKFEGDSYPRIKNNYIESPQAPAIVKVTNSTGGVVDTLFLEFESNFIDCGSATSLLYILDFNGAEADWHTFTKNQVIRTPSSMLGVVRDKGGNVDSFSRCYKSYANFSTGNLSSIYLGLDKIYLNERTVIKSTANNAQIRCENSTGTQVKFGWATPTQSEIEVPTGVEQVIDIGGVDVAKWDENSTAGQTRFFLYDNATGVLQRVKVGSNNSGPGGSGRALYINNS